MRWAFQVILFFAVSSFGTSLVGEEYRVKDQPSGDLIKQLADKDPEKLCAAAKALGKLASTADAVSALKGLLKNRNGRAKWSAAEALWLLEHKAAELVPVYAELLTATDANVRAASAWRLGRLGSAARPAVLMLAGALRDENAEVRIQVGQALANLGADAELALPALVRALGSKQVDEFGFPREAWDNLRSSPALPALVELADDAIPLLLETFRMSAVKRDGKDSSEPGGSEIAARVAFAFPAFGARAVPPLLQALSSKDADTRTYAAVALRQMAELNGLPENAIDKLEKCLDDSDKGVRSIAAGALSWVRPSSTKAVTMLVKATGDLEIRTGELLAALERMSPHNEAARKVLLHMLGSDSVETTREAHRILAKFELPADQLLGVWIKALSDIDQKVRGEAIAVLGKLGPRAKPAMDALVERLKRENDYYNKGNILGTLTAIDPDDPALVPLLVKSLDDKESWVRWRAINILGDHGPRAKDALAALEALLLNTGDKGKAGSLDSSDMRDLVTGIVRIAPGSAKTAATLLKALRNKEIRSVHCPKNSWNMRELLEDQFQALLPAAVPLLRQALKDEDVLVRQSVALVLVRAGLEIETALPVLMDKLWLGTEEYGEEAQFQRRVVELLQRRRHSATPAIATAWCKAWQAAHPEVRKILEPGLIVLQPEALPHLLDQLQTAKTAQAKRDLAHLLAQFDGQSKRVVPILREELRESNPVAQHAATEALRKLGPDAAEAVPELIKLLSHKHPGMRALAVRALGNIGRGARPAVPALKPMLKDAEQAMRIMAANALSQIDPDASEALAFLRDMLINEKDAGPVRFGTAAFRFPEGVKDYGIFPDSIEESITRFGERAVTVLAEVLDNVDLDEWSTENRSAQCGAYPRIQAALLLANLGPEAKSAVPALIRALKDRDPFIREAAASALGRIGPAAKKAAPDFIALLEQQNRLAFAAGAWSSAPRAISRSRTGSRYEYGGPFDFRSVGRSKMLSRNMGFGYGYREVDPYAHIRPDYPYDPAYVLGRIDGETRSSQPILSEMAKDTNHPGRLPAALALWRSGCDAPDLIPAFTAALETHVKNNSAALTREMRECLSELDVQLKPAARVMSEWLRQRESSAGLDDQVAVLEALGRLGADARGPIDVIRPLLQGDYWHAKRRVAAALALFRIRGDRDLVFPVLREVLTGDRPSIVFRRSASEGREEAARALGVLADNGDERARAIIVETAKGDENPNVRVAALEALARQKQTNETAMKGLCALLRHSHYTVRAEVAAACGRLGARAKSSVKALKAATEDSNLAVRQAARQALELLD